MPHEDLTGGIEKTMDEELRKHEVKDETEKKKRETTALIERWKKKIQHCRDHDEDARKQWADDRRVARGDTGWLVDTNLVGAIMEVLASFIYARNPDISAKPTDSVGRAYIEDFRTFAETLQIIVSRMLKDAGMKKIGKRWVRAAMTVGVGWIKAALQTRTDKDPLIQTQINDLTDNIKRIEVMKSQSENEEFPEQDAMKANLEIQIKTLNEKLEISVAEGTVLDLMAAEDVGVAPEAGEIENYLNSPYIYFDLYKTKEDALMITGWKTKEDKELLGQANIFLQKPRKAQDTDDSAISSKEWVTVTEDPEAESQDGFVRFIEIWSKNDGTVYTMIDGIKEKWAREPYAPITGLRFYPIFGTWFHPIDGDRWPQSDVFRLKKLQDEYGRSRSNFAEHRARAIPNIIFDEGVIEEESVAKLTASERAEYVGVKTTSPGTDLRTLLVPKTYNNIDPGLYDTSPITVDMEKVSGAQDAKQSSVQIEKTATEARIQESGFGARIESRRDMMEEVMTELADYIAQVALQVLDEKDAQKYAGPEAAWTRLSAEEAHRHYQMEIKAGSTGKPDAASDREAWTVLLPLMQDLIERIGQARVAGQEWAAQPWIALLQETMNRLDDTADIELFLPEAPPPSPPKPEEPTRLELSQIEKNEAAALLDKANAFEKFPDLFTNPELLNIENKILDQLQPPEGPQDTPAEPLVAAPNPLTDSV